MGKEHLGLLKVRDVGEGGISDLAAERQALSLSSQNALATSSQTITTAFDLSPGHPLSGHSELRTIDWGGRMASTKMTK